MMLRVLLFKTAVVLSVSTPVFLCADTGSQLPPAEIVSRYQNALKDAPTGGKRAEVARAFAGSLTDRDRLALARELAAGTRQDDAVFGAGRCGSAAEGGGAGLRPVRHHGET